MNFRNIFRVLLLVGLFALFAIAAPPLLSFTAAICCAVLFFWKAGRGVMRISCGAATIALLLLLNAPPSAQAQTEATQTNLLTGIPAIVTGGSTSNIVSGEILVHQGKGLALFPFIQGNAAAATNALTVNLDTRGDGTNWTTTGPLSGSVIANGATGVRGMIIFTPDQLRGVRAVRTKSFVSNGGAGTNINITNIVASVPW